MSLHEQNLDMLFTYHDDNPKMVISSLLDSLVMGSFRWPAHLNTIASPRHIRLICVVLLPRLPVDLQSDVLGVFTQMLANCRNGTACAQVRSPYTSPRISACKP